ncbi:3-deoxy-D-arabino-heptulosonate-7-phosphate synthase, tyrosine-repressible [Nitrospira sp. KM1]|nr:3-deoxy-7-phosphoheptulonate synthase [Nitrospira sp. KM1]BCA54180.1 3-deoxy-D-arabino-heptulosonate-7-phosphate synthase, tyrosine-repressible [Nitrospira sp. KM1]
MAQSLRLELWTLRPDFAMLRHQKYKGPLMNRPLDNQHVIEIKALPSPRSIKTKLPITDQAAALVVETREAIRRILHGQDRERLLVIVGPCSIHDPDAAFEYAARLKPLADSLRDRLLIVMRTYFEKPRTTVGWKGLINDPHLDGTCDIATGMELARTLLLKLNQSGMPCATELLDPIAPQYIADLISWTAIGARTTESQTHREMASGVSMPVGFKNGTEGSLQVAINAMTAARTPHHFVGINADGQTSIIKTTGNPDRHIVLRGGGGKTNYDADHVARAEAAVAGEQIARPIMIDCSHDNSSKDHRRQGPVAREVLRQFKEGRQSIMGLMLESNLNAGKQTWRQGTALAHGVSITDACLGWEETELLLNELADSLVAKPA